MKNLKFNLFLVTFGALVIRSLVFGLDWPTMGLLSLILGSEVFYKYLADNKAKEVTVDYERRLQTLENRSNLNKLTNR